jgi:PAS domain S-box-containing protein
MRATKSSSLGQESRFRTIVEHATDLILLYDLDFHCLYINPAAQSALGVNRSALLNRPGTLLARPVQRARFESCFRRVLESGQEQVLVIPLFGPKGEAEYQVRLVPEKDPHTGVVLAVIGVGRDVTALKSLERELRKTSRAKSEFLANMSHEIRTPLAGILGLAEMSLKRDMAPDLREDLRMISDSAASLNRIINDILDFSKIEAGKIELQPHGFELDGLIGSVLKTFKVPAQSKAIGLFVEVGKEVPRTLVGDPLRLKQILSNLVSNAIKFTDRGFVRVGISAEQSENGKVHLRFAVQDTGSGIPKSKLDRLFKSFIQLDLSSSKRHEGTGLGLIISRQLAQLMGGTIEVQSRLGKGSTFTLRLPFDAAARVVPKKRPAQDGSSVQPGKAALKILLAEDNPVNRAFLTRYLTGSGHLVGSVANGLEALRALERERYDLVLMDIQMPEMDGLEATRRIRSGGLEGIDPHLPVVALTAYAMKGDRERFLEAGMNGYVSKPVDFSELDAVIGELSVNNEGDGDSGAQPPEEVSA